MSVRSAEGNSIPGSGSRMSEEEGSSQNTVLGSARRDGLTQRKLLAMLIAVMIVTSFLTLMTVKNPGSMEVTQGVMDDACRIYANATKARFIFGSNSTVVIQCDGLGGTSVDRFGDSIILS